MNKKIIFLTIIVFSAISTFAQQIPLGSCGFVYIHDASGNRTRRVYFCNNGSPYPTVVNPAGNDNKQTEKDLSFTREEIKNMEFQPVDALYPNPTTGIFFITFSKSLVNANIIITDNNGKLIKQYKTTGFKLTCDLSSLAAGIYFVKIEENGQLITKKVIKQ